MRQSAIFVWPLCLLATWLAILLSPPIASALPPGRTWTPFAQMSIPGTVDYLGMPVLDRDADGMPYFAIDVRWDTATVRRWAVFGWRDSSWALRFSSDQRTGNLAQFVLRAEDRRTLAWRPGDAMGFYTWLTLADLSLDSLGPPETVFRTTTQSSEWGVAASARRRWAVRSENYAQDPVNHIRVFYSDTTHIWREVQRLGVDEDHCTVAPLGDTTAIVVYAGRSGLQYAILDGTLWSETGNLDPRPFNAANPRFRLRRSGGLWLFWADHGWMHMSTYRNGAWERGDSLRCLPNEGETFRPTWVNAEHDTTEYPAFAWTNGGYGNTWRDVTAIAFPNGHGWDPGEEIANSELSGAIEPTLTTDVNGDVWLIWRQQRTGINRWIHTYCSATCAAPSVAPREGGARLTWALSSRAPRSRWTVLRSADDGAFDSLATVRAGEDSVFVFDDPAARPGVSWRYRIRRESVDIRYRWESAVSEPWPYDHRAPLGLALANPTGERLTFRLTSAVGLIWARLYDLQGRVVLAERLDASGTGEGTFTLDLGGSGARRPGMYFLRVTDSTGRASRVARVAVIR